MASVKKAIKIFTRLKPSDSSTCKYEIDKHINDDGSTDDILILNSSSAEDYTTSQSVNRPEAYKFRYSKVFDGNSNQDDVFDEICQPVLESALQGYNGTIFAYGQTGSGKTYTMTGSRQQWKNRGIIPRALSYIFEKFNELTDHGFIASAFLSYLEIYNENGYDLLHSGFSSGRIEDLKKVQLLEDAQQQIHMKNLTVHPIKSEDEAMQLLYLGDHNRIIAETPMNEASTRSHCIFTIHLNIREGDSSTVRRSKVHLVDLAGSERLAHSNSTGQLFHEARHINLALHYLEQVIVALGEAHRSHIPYRNSMMTSILRDSLGGNCMTSMIATVSLEHRNIMETLSTCRFSQRVALVTNAAMLNEETDPMLLIAQLKLENKRLKEIIANSSIKQIEQNPNPLSQEEVADCWKLVEKFMSDSDEEAILPVPPDMRMVQTCFRCLKMAVQLNKEDFIGITGVESSTSLSPKTNFHQNRSRMEMPQYSTDDMTREQLVDALRIRDAEIDVLTKMIRPQKSKNSTRMVNGSFHNASNKGLFGHGDGPEQTSPRHKKRSSRRSSDSLSEDDDEEERRRDSISNEYQKMTIKHSHKESDDEASPVCSGKGDFDSESLFIEGLSESKKQALDSFMRSYKGREKLENVRDNLLSKRNEVESIESLLRRNHATLNNLKLVIMNSEGAEEDDRFIKEAVGSQTVSIQKQEVQLQKCREEMRHIEESLKALYAQLMSDFEKHWLSVKEFRGKSGMKDDDDQGSKPLSEMTKGIVKGVGGGHHKSFSRMDTSNQFSISPPPHRHNSRSSYPPSSASRRKQHSRCESGRSSKMRDKQHHQSSISVQKGRSVPPGTPALSTARLELLHRHPHADFATESTNNFYDVGMDDDRDDDELIKDLPMTGDATIDQEILSFFRTRQAVFKKINNDKASRSSPHHSHRSRHDDSR